MPSPATIAIAAIILAVQVFFWIGCARLVAWAFEYDLTLKQGLILGLVGAITLGWGR